MKSWSKVTLPARSGAEPNRSPSRKPLSRGQEPWPACTAREGQQVAAGPQDTLGGQGETARRMVPRS